MCYVQLLPPRTFHAAENLTPVVSYSRLHVSWVEMDEWMKSFCAKDGGQLPYKELVKNGSQLLLSKTNHDAEEMRFVLVFVWRGF